MVRTVDCWISPGCVSTNSDSVKIRFQNKKTLRLKYRRRKQEGGKEGKRGGRKEGRKAGKKEERTEGRAREGRNEGTKERMNEGSKKVGREGRKERLISVSQTGCL